MRSARFGEVLKQEHYDAVIDLQGAVRSALIGRMAKSRRYIGEASPREAAAKLACSPSGSPRAACT